MVRWNLYRFDYVRFVELRPFLRSASAPSAFAELADSPDTDAIVAAFNEGEIDVVAARQAIVISIGCVGEPLPFPNNFAGVLRRLRKDIRGEEGFEILIDAIVGGRNIETWLAPGGELVGLLTPTEVKTVLDAYRSGSSSTRKRLEPSLRPKRRGGLLPNIATFLRHLFDRGLAIDELYRLLGELLEEAVSNGEGIAVVTA